MPVLLTLLEVDPTLLSTLDKVRLWWWPTTPRHLSHASILQDGNTVLHLAAWRGRVMLVQFLLAVSDNIGMAVNNVCAYACGWWEAEAKS